MSYRCQVCRELAPRGQPRLLHPIHRTIKATGRTEIAQEIPVCRPCKDALDRGQSLTSLAQACRFKEEAEAVKAEPVPEPAAPEPAQARPYQARKISFD